MNQRAIRTLRILVPILILSAIALAVEAGLRWQH
jgi:hypothetical protein